MKETKIRRHHDTAHEEALARVRIQLCLSNVKGQKLIIFYLSILAMLFVTNDISQPSTTSSNHPIYLALSVVFVCASTALLRRERRAEEKACRDLSLYLSTLPGPTTLLSYKYIQPLRIHILNIECHDRDKYTSHYIVQLSAEAGLEIIESRKHGPHYH